MLDKVGAGAENFARWIEELPENRLREDFADQKYRNYYKNLHGIIEHIHYQQG